MPGHYYNEHNRYRAAVLRERMADGLIPHGEVDERNIEEIPDEYLRGSNFDQIHLFAGIGGFPVGLRLAGFPESGVRIVTGGFPCQDISNAGKRAGISGARSGLWSEMLRCIRVVRPDYVFVENVAALLNRGMGTVLGDLAGIGYCAEWDRISAASVGAPHLRQRIFIVAFPDAERRAGRAHHEGEAPPERRRIEQGGEVADAAGSIERIEPIRVSQCTSAPELINGGETRRKISDVDGSCEKLDTDRKRIISLRTRFAAEIMADTAERGFAMRGQSSGRGGFAQRGGEVVADADGRRYEQRDSIERGISEFDAGSAEISDADGAQGPRFGEHGGEILSESEASGLGASGSAGWWAVEPDVGRVANGIPARVDRLAALGDAIVPQCVAEVIKRFFATY